MIRDNNTLYATVAVWRHDDGTLRVLLPGYDRGISVHDDSSEDRGHRALYVGLEALLGKKVSN